jgi:hypothetical protein
MTLSTAQVQEIIKGINQLESDAFESIEKDYEFITDDLTFKADVSISVISYGDAYSDSADQHATSSITVNEIECYNEQGNDILTEEIRKEIYQSF